MLKSVSISVCVASAIAFAVSTPVQAQVTRCQIQPRPDQPSPLGMRAGLDVEEKGSDVTFTYTNFPSFVSSDQPPVTIAQQRTMIFYKTTLAAARQRMLSDPKYFNELRGFTEPEGFKPFNDLLVCKPVTAATLPARGSIADLPDGQYRFWNGSPSSTVTDNQILAGAYIFLFTKTGNRIVGYFARPSDDSMCMTGTAKGNTITGVINPPERFPNPAARQNKTFDPAGYLKLGAWNNQGNLGSFSPSTLDLSRFSRINLGNRRPPSICR